MFCPFLASSAVVCPPVPESHLEQRAAGSFGDMSVLLTVQACRLVAAGATKERRAEQTDFSSMGSQIVEETY